jgi:hypothetical protein
VDTDKKVIFSSPPVGDTPAGTVGVQVDFMTPPLGMGIELIDNAIIQIHPNGLAVLSLFAIDPNTVEGIGEGQGQALAQAFCKARYAVTHDFLLRLQGAIDTHMERLKAAMEQAKDTTNG